MSDTSKSETKAKLAAAVSTYVNTRQGLAGKPLTQPGPQDELLHPPAPSGHYSSTETQYFGFNIPEHRLNGEIYVWFHPVLKMMSVSVYIWKDLKASTLACEYVNHFHYLPMPEGGNIDDWEIPECGLRIKVLDPLKSVQIDCADDVRGVSFTLKMDAIMPPGGKPSGDHFTQAMKCTGRLDLYGETLVIDGYFSRDRSWSQERREVSRVGPPVTWMVGVWDDDFAFHCTAFDSIELEPEWADRYPMEPGKNLGWGYVWRDKELFPVVRARKRTLREPDGVSPRLFELEIEDAGGQTHSLRGEVMARMPWQTWQNMNVFFCLTRWQSDRGVGWGDAQDIQQNDFTRTSAR